MSMHDQPGTRRHAPDPMTEANGEDAGTRSYMHLPAVVSHIDGVPVYAYGRMFVYGVSPDFERGVVLQEGQRSAPTKIRPKKTWEMAGNGIGSMISYAPRLPRNDLQPFLALNLIDGDPVTCWCSRGQGQATVEPAWIRIDLACETTLREVALLPRADGQGLPAQLTVKVSCDGWHWDTVYEGRTDAVPRDGGRLHVALTPARPVKQIWVTGFDLPTVMLGDPAQRDDIIGVVLERNFVLAAVEARDAQGDNLALAARGATVTVSSTNYGYGSSWDVYDLLWPVQYDLGATWMRLSGSNAPYYHDTLSWRFVEQRKGQYVIDPKTDLAITEAARNGYQIMVTLTYGNWLYTPTPEQASLDARDFPRPFPPVPVTPESVEGYANWVRFMVTHFKGRIACWEIYNEPVFFGWDRIKDFDEKVRLYCELVKAVVPVIREADPAARISLAGMAGVPGPVDEANPLSTWLYKCLEHDVARLVDVIGWHIQGHVYPELRWWQDYPVGVREFKQAAEARGFRGEYMATELWMGSPYPTHEGYVHPPHNAPPGLPRLSDMRKAKDMARIFVLNLGLGVKPFWCNTWFDYVQNDGGLFRNTFAADPVSPMQPEPAYYVLRTLCTTLDGAVPTDLAVTIATDSGAAERWSFALPDRGLLVAVWLGGSSADRHPGVVGTVRIGGVRARAASAVDTLNGTECELACEQDDAGLTIPSLRIPDYPLLLRLVDVAQ